MKYLYSQPAVLVEDANGIHQLQSKSLLLKNRVIFVDDEICSDTANEIIRQILLMAAQSHDPITLVLDSPGGSTQAGLQLVDVMRSCPCVIRTIALGCAASMSAVLLAAGTKGNRFISPHSRVMLHEPLLAGGVSGSTTHIESVANDLKATRKIINDLLCQYTGQSTEVLRKATSYDHYFDAQEAVDFGLADAVIADGKLFGCLLGGNVYA